jgi:hypothetical protein
VRIEEAETVVMANSGVHSVDAESGDGRSTPLMREQLQALHRWRRRTAKSGVNVFVAARNAGARDEGVAGCHERRSYSSFREKGKRFRMCSLKNSPLEKDFLMPS